MNSYVCMCKYKISSVKNLKHVHGLPSSMIFPGNLCCIEYSGQKPWICVFFYRQLSISGQSTLIMQEMHCCLIGSPEVPVPGWVGLQQRQCLNVWVHCLTSFRLSCCVPGLSLDALAAAYQHWVCTGVSHHFACSPDYWLANICVLARPPKPKNLLFSSLARSLELQACLKNSATHFKCFLLLIYYCLSRGVLWKLAHILSVPFFSIFPFFACRSSCFFPSSNPLFPSVDTTATTEPAVHGWYHITVYLLSQRCWEARQAWEKEKCSLQGKSYSKYTDLKHTVIV